MQSQMLASSARPTANLALWGSRIINAILILFLIFDSVIKIIQHPEAVTPTVGFGFALGMVSVLGAIELAALILYVIPNTAVLGAITLTGYLGGAIATQVRAEAPLFSIVFPVILGAFMWLALYLRDSRVRALLPLRSRDV